MRAVPSGRFEQLCSLECNKCLVNESSPIRQLECAECPDGSVSDGRRCRPRSAAPRVSAFSDIIGKNVTVEKQRNLRLQNGLPCVACADLPWSTYATCPTMSLRPRQPAVRGRRDDRAEGRMLTRTTPEAPNAGPKRNGQVHGGEPKFTVPQMMPVPNEGYYQRLPLGWCTALGTGRMAQAGYYPFRLPDDYGALEQAGLGRSPRARGKSVTDRLQGREVVGNAHGRETDRARCTPCVWTWPRQGGGELHPLAAVQ